VIKKVAPLGRIEHPFGAKDWRGGLTVIKKVAPLGREEHSLGLRIGEGNLL